MLKEVSKYWDYWREDVPTAWGYFEYNGGIIRNFAEFVEEQKQVRVWSGISDAIKIPDEYAEYLEASDFMEYRWRSGIVFIPGIGIVNDITNFDAPFVFDGYKIECFRDFEAVNRYHRIFPLDIVEEIRNGRLAEDLRAYEQHGGTVAAKYWAALLIETIKDSIPTSMYETFLGHCKYGKKTVNSFVEFHEIKSEERAAGECPPFDTAGAASIYSYDELTRDFCQYITIGGVSTHMERETVFSRFIPEDIKPKEQPAKDPARPGEATAPEPKEEQHDTKLSDIARDLFKHIKPVVNAGDDPEQHH